MTPAPAQTCQHVPSKPHLTAPEGMTPGITAPQHTRTLLVLVAGAARVLQLRRVARPRRRADQLP